MRKIKVITKRVGEPPRMVWISDSLENLQRTVGGYIETVTVASDLVIICDEEGRLKGRPHNFSLANVDFVGDVIICGVRGDRFADVPMTLKQAREYFPSLWAGLDND